MKLLLLSLLVSLNLYAASIEIKKPFVRLLPPSAPNTAAFMKIYNNTDRDIVLTSAIANISKTVELHGHEHINGLMRMRQVKQITLKANSTTSLEPGGLHIMFMGLKKPLFAKQEILLTLKFSNFKDLQVKIPVLDK
ncbi:MAG: copper chaperone PCu(A)C [Bacteriovoracaceae bacterium]|jgi:copper(I)-binding protein|nr:copper chaperone PCu(A)C [Bacteriovoracaceae bacterium]